jgi:hypothetical protein
MTVPPAPWGKRAPEIERTPDGQEIIRNKFGAFVMRPDGAFEPYETPEEYERKLLKRTPRAPSHTWSVWD